MFLCACSYVSYVLCAHVLMHACSYVSSFIYFFYIIASEDGDYEVSAEMLIHEDIDDERTLQEEEERMEEEGEGGDTEDELIDLQKVRKDYNPKDVDNNNK